MSTKTTFKRIALVAVAALGLSLVAVAPSNAAANAILTYAVGDGAPAGDLNTGNGIAGPANTVTLGHMGSATLQSYVTVSGASATIATGGTVAAGGAATLIGTGAANTNIVVRTPAVGTIVASVFRETGAGSGIFATTAAETVTITVNATAVTGLVSATLSSEVTSVTGTGILNADGSILGSRAFGVKIGQSVATLVSAVGTVPTTQAVSVVVTGPGYVVVTGATTVTGKNVTTTKGAGNVTLEFYGDGFAGDSTVTFTAGAYTYTEKITYYGSASAFKVASTTSSGLGAGTVVKNLGITDTQTWQLSTVDAAGNTVSTTPGITVTVADTTIMNATASNLNTGTVVITGVKAGTSTFTVKDSATGLIVLGPVTVNVSAKTAASATFALDKTDYAQGEVFTLTITAKDANGLPLADGQAAYAGMATLATSALVYSNTVTALGGTVNPTFSGGVATIKGFMPVNSATVAFSLTLGTVGVATAAQGAVLTATATVSNPEVQASQDAAAEATDAANAATDAANAAAEAADAATAAAQDAADAVAALSTEVAAMITALKKQITALTNLVIKIQKKVKA
jgi:hypothetical protein